MPYPQTLTTTTAAVLASSLEARYHQPFPPSPDDLLLAVRAAQLALPDLVCAVSASPHPAALHALEEVAGRPVTRCPPRTCALDWATGLPRSPAAVDQTPRRRRARRPVSDPRRIVSVAPNPKKPGSACHARYALYEPGLTLDECVARGVTRPDIRWDTRQGFVVVAPFTSSEK